MNSIIILSLLILIMIILLGFPKSGTTSFHKLFIELGYDSYHWKYKDQYIGNLIKINKNKGKRLLSFIKKSDYNKTIITQMDVCMNKQNNYWPQIVDYQRLYYENKDAIFILNKRNPLKIIKSMKNWKNQNGETLFDRIIKYSNELLIQTDKLSNENKVLNLILNHYYNIEKFFKEQRNIKFIIYDIDNNKIDKLKKYINIGNNKFPHENQNHYSRLIYSKIFKLLILIISLISILFFIEKYNFKKLNKS